MSTCDRGAPIRIAVALIVHVILWSLLLVTLTVFGPRFDSYFRDYGLKLPTLTEYVLSASRLLYRFLPLTVAGFLLFLAVDGAVMVLASQLRAALLPGRVWGVVMALVPLLGLLLVWGAFLYPGVKLLEGMSR